MRDVKTWTVRPRTHNPLTGETYNLWDIEDSETVLQDYRNQGWKMEWTSPEIATHEAFNVMHLNKNWFAITEVK
jgi:hypothetical protein